MSGSTETPDPNAQAAEGGAGAPPPSDALVGGQGGDAGQGGEPAATPAEGDASGGAAAQPPEGARNGGAVPAWAQRRFDELTRQRYEAERKAQEYQQRLEALEAGRAYEPPAQAPAQQGAGESDADFNARVEREIATRTFNQKCDNLVLKGRGQFTDFDDRMKQWGALGGIPQPLVEAVLEAAPDDGAKVLYDLGGNLEEAYRISRLTPAQMGAAVAKLVGGPKAPAPRVSGAPDPTPRVGGAGEPPEKDPDSMSTEEWMAWRDKQEASRRAGA